MTINQSGNKSSRRFAMRVALTFIVFLYLNLVLGGPTRMKKGKLNTTIKKRGIRNKGQSLMKNARTHEITFPHSLDLLLDADDFSTEIRATIVDERTSRGNGHSAADTVNKKQEAFYVNSEGAYVVIASDSSENGTIETDIKGVRRTKDGRKCWLSHGEEYCWQLRQPQFGTKQSFGDVLHVPDEDRVAMIKKREAPLNEADFSTELTVEIAYVVDDTFLDWFRQFNVDETTARAEAVYYILLLNNEVNYLYASIKEVSHASPELEDIAIVTHASGILLPPEGDDWPFIVENLYQDEGNIILAEGGTFNDMRAWISDSTSLINKYQWDLVELITGADLSKNKRPSGDLGIAYIDVVCTSFDEYKLGLNEDLENDVLLTLTHELGHGLGAPHDGGQDSCADDAFLMATYLIYPSLDNKDKFNLFSTCSVQAITDHLRFYGTSCLENSRFSDNQFFFNLCQESRSEVYDLDYQCARAFREPASTACNYTDVQGVKAIEASHCWDEEKIQCTDSTGVCNLRLFSVYEGTACIGPDPAKDYICYRAECTEKFSLCNGPRTTTTPIPHESTTPGSCSCENVSFKAQRICCSTTVNTDSSCCTGCKVKGDKCTVNN